MRAVCALLLAMASTAAFGQPVPSPNPGCRAFEVPTELRTNPKPGEEWYAIDCTASPARADLPEEAFAALQEYLEAAGKRTGQRVLAFAPDKSGKVFVAIVSVNPH